MKLCNEKFLLDFVLVLLIALFHFYLEFVINQVTLKEFEVHGNQVCTIRWVMWGVPERNLVKGTAGNIV